MSQNKWIELSGLWTKQNDKGKFMTGTLNGYTLLILPNGHKSEDRHPDFRLLLATEKRTQQEKPKPKPAETFEDDVPF